MTGTPDDPEEDTPPASPPAPQGAEEPPAHPPAEAEETAAPPEPPPAPPHAVQPTQRPAPDTAAPGRQMPWVPILVVAGVLLALGLGVFVWRGMSAAPPQDEAYVVQPFTPASELITARDRVEARAEPDAASRVVVIFGQGVTLNVSGRVQRGLANDWYAISWNDQTAFVRMQDVTPGSGAPPTPIVREREEEEEEVKQKEKPPEVTEPEDRVAAPRGALGIGDVNWIREPNARDFARYFPDRALADGQSGNVTLSCIVGGGGRLACSVASESPAGYGFGRAAINISRQLRVRTTLPDGSSAEGREMRLPLSFRAN